jgi:transcriptional regulator with XRE-family HTH domain
MVKLGDMLRELREERDLKQKEVADALFISNKILSSYERNISQPPIDMLKRICEYYQVSADMLLGIGAFSPNEAPCGSPDTTAVYTPEDSSGILDADDHRILGYYHRLDAESQEAIRGLLICYCKEQERREALRLSAVSTPAANIIF